jgi:uncharacterized repeat protein (TIGR01451 family)
MNTHVGNRRIFSRASGYAVIGVFIFAFASLAFPLYRVNSTSLALPSVSANKSQASNGMDLGARSAPAPSHDSGWITHFEAPFIAPTVAIYASDCTTPQTTFNLQDTDKTVCAKVTGATPGWRVIWSNANFVAVQSDNLTSANQDVTFTLSSSSSLGTWRVILFEPFGGGVQAVAPFVVQDAGNPVADLSVSKSAVTDEASAGSQVIFTVQVTNLGPSPASNVQLTDDVPANTSFGSSGSFAQLSGPVFSCTSTTSTTSCTIATLQAGETAQFLATYVVDSGASTGTIISNTANIFSDTFDNHNGAPDSFGNPTPNNNTSSATATVITTPCVFTPPSNITQDADPGQAGAIVNYSTPSHTGDCGQDSTDPETGNVIPAISCTPASGSFFGVGTTSVICSSQTGAVSTFQVTINNPGGLSISLSGSNSVTVECGTQFTDPGATAVDASGASVPVTVAYSQGFDPNTPQVGTYTATYTATEGSNSTSTQRTINVTDTKAPKITLKGSNPYKIEQGTCLPFVDPGVSATDDCAGAETVSSSISGPGGLTTVDPNTPGTYTITYTSSDGTHNATATRSVLVGHFPPDEQDLGTSNGTPVITLLGGDPETHAVTAECGMFVDPGATATTACGNPLTYTVSGTFDQHTPGTYVLTYTVTDGSQSASVQRTVTITADNTAPTITLNGVNPMTVECHTTFTDPGAVAHDACAGDFPATASGTVNANVPGTYTITYNATDPSGHAATPVTRTVNVVDSTAPVVTAPANVTVFTGAGNTFCALTISDATLGTATANDSCQGSLAVTRSGVPAGNVFPVGTTTITYSATDASNNTGTATQTVTVIDNTPPVISCPASLTLEPTCPSGAIANYTPPVGTDNCAGATTSRTAGLASGSVFPIGTTTVTYTVTDAAGNSSSCSFTVTVKTAAQTIQAMMAAVQALQPPLTGTQIQGLNSKLQAALDAISQGKTNVACNKLSDFISQVTAYINNGTLTLAQGTPLITSANHVRNTIGCTNNPCS